jgi:hypothetical protein
MDRLGLSHADLATYNAGLLVSHERRITVSVLDMDGDVLDELDTSHPTVAASMSGQVSVDSRANPSRTLSLSFIDPKGALLFDPGSPAGTGLHVSRQVRVRSSRNIPGLGWVGCTVFTGPPRAFNRTGETVQLTAYSRDCLGLGSLWSAFSRKKGTKKTAVIRDLLGRYGESNFDIPDLGARLPAHLSLHRDQSPWPHAVKLAHSMNRQLCYFGSDRVHMRQLPNHPLMTLDDYAVTKIGAQRSLDNVKNAVRVVGGKPKGSKTQVIATAVLEPEHDLSPKNLGGSNGRLYLVDEVNNPHLRSKREAQRVADQHLEDKARELVTVTFDAVPLDHLQENDLLRAAGITFRLRQFTIPLSMDGNPVSSIGTLKKTSRA